MTEYQKSDPQTIQALFSSIARTYDRTNAVLSFRMHHGWNTELVNRVCAEKTPNKLLDLCCGTGEIGFNFLKQPHPPEQIFMLDFCKEMLECAKAKEPRLVNAKQCTLSYIQGDAQEIPLPSSSVSAVTIAYGIRNVKDPARCLKEVFRVLQPQGTFGILELTRPVNPFLRFGHYVYLRTLLPMLGRLFSANQEAYEYLCNSIHTFVKPEEIKLLLSETGFKQMTQIGMAGGIATILIAKKPT